MKLPQPLPRMKATMTNVTFTNPRGSIHSQSGGLREQAEPLLLAVRLTASRPHPQPQLPSPSSAQTPTPRITTTQSQSVATKKSRKKRGCQPIPHAAQAAPGRLLPLGLPTGPAAGERPSPSRPPVAIPLLSRIARPRRLSISKYLGDCSPALPALVTKSVGFFLFFFVVSPTPSPDHLHRRFPRHRPTSGRHRPHRAYNSRRVTGQTRLGQAWPAPPWAVGISH